jgi:D-sedoheptulose 7-phosphate isomerase
MAYAADYQNRLLSTLQSIDLEKIAQAMDWFEEARGNGGSAATAAHFVCDMVKGASFGRTLRFRIQALNESMPVVTAYSNDVSYSDAICEQLKNFARSGDLYMAISGSGNSANVIRALDFAKSVGCRTLALTGRDGGNLGPRADLNIQVRETHMGRIEDAHHIICHMVAYSFME